MKISEKQTYRLFGQLEKCLDKLDSSFCMDAGAPDFGDQLTVDLPILAVVVGHTRRSPGAYVGAPINDYEYGYNKKLAKLMQKHAPRYGCRVVVFYRDGIGIAGVYKAVKAAGASLCIEIHVNAFNSQTTGTETLVGTSAISRPWAELLHQSMVEVFRNGHPSRGIKVLKVGQRGGRNVNQLPLTPNVLLEPFFGDSEAHLGIEKMHEYIHALLSATEVMLKQNMRKAS